MINKGSEWNIWDLHVHTPASGFASDSDYPTLIDNLKASHGHSGKSAQESSGAVWSGISNSNIKK